MERAQEGFALVAGTTIRDNGIQMDKEIQNPVSEHKNNAHALNIFAIRNLYISHYWISKI